MSSILQTFLLAGALHLDPAQTKDYEAITTMTRELRALAEQNASLDDTRLKLNDPLAG